MGGGTSEEGLIGVENRDVEKFHVHITSGFADPGGGAGRGQGLETLIIDLIFTMMGESDG